MRTPVCELLGLNSRSSWRPWSRFPAGRGSPLAAAVSHAGALGMVTLVRRGIGDLISYHTME
jgi:hypothetical protein